QGLLMNSRNVQYLESRGDRPLPERWRQFPVQTLPQVSAQSPSIFTRERSKLIFHGLWNSRTNCRIAFTDLSTRRWVTAISCKSFLASCEPFCRNVKSRTLIA